MAQVTRAELEDAIRFYSAQGDNDTVVRLGNALEGISEPSTRAAAGAAVPADVPNLPATPPVAAAPAPPAEPDYGLAFREGIRDINNTLLGLPGTLTNIAVNAPGALVNTALDASRALRLPGLSTVDWRAPRFDTGFDITDAAALPAHPLLGVETRDPRDMTFGERVVRTGTSVAPTFAIPYAHAARAPTVVGAVSTRTPAGVITRPPTAAEVLTETGAATAMREGGRTLAKNVAADVGELAAGTAAVEGVREAGFEGTLPEVAAEVTGALAGRGATRAAGELAMPVARTDVPTVRDSASGRPIPRGETESAAALLQTQVEQGGRGAAETAAEIRQGIDELRAAGVQELPTAGALTDSPGVLVQDTRTRLARQPETIARDEAVQEEAAGITRQLAPEGPTAVEPGAAAAEELAARRAAVPAAAGTPAAEQAVQQAEAATTGTQLASRVPGDRRRDIARYYEDTFNVSRDKRDDLYAQIDPDPTTAPRVVQVTSTATAPTQTGAVTLTSRNPGVFPLEDAAASIRAARGRLGGNALNDWERIIQDVEDLAPQPGAAPQPGQTGFASLSDLQDLRKRLTHAMSVAQRSQNPTVASDLYGALKQSKAAIDTIYDTLDTGGATGREAAESAAAATTARRYMTEQFGPAFKEGESGAIRQAARGARPVPEEDVAGRFLRPGAGGATRAQQLKQITEMSTDPKGMEDTVEQYLTDDLAQSFQDRNLNPQELRKWRSAYGDALDQFPDIRDRVDRLIDEARQADVSLADAQSRLRMSQAAEKDLLTALKDDPLNVVAGADRENAVRAVMRSKHPARTMAEVTEALRGNPEAFQSWKADVQNFIQDQIKTATVAGKEQAPSFAKVDNLMRRHEDTLRALYGDQGVETLNKVRTVMRNQARLSRQVKPGSDTAARQASDSERQMAALTLLVRVKFGILKGGGIMRTIREAAKGLNIGNPDRMIEDVLNQAMIDPELAEKLLSTEIKAGRRPNLAPLVTIMREAGMGGIAEFEEDMRQEDASP